MAYLVFKNEEGLTRSAGTLIRAAKTDADVQIIHGGKSDTVNTVEITDAEYLNIVKETHTFEKYNSDGTYVIYDNSLSDNDHPGTFTRAQIEEWIEGDISIIDLWLKERSESHPERSVWTAYKQTLQNIDLDALNLTYPTNKTPQQLVEDAGGTPKNPGLQVPK
jgi:hypothetical protein